ncbi:MAG: TRAP transporter substrate-binding protein [Desulfarculaceae bacterium]|nr:TRAP transporter substrate-binding protein [Desulfarculaceae bacterium]MCF8046361.1 TRAP transporter substrate-binding protein [Desulfarculaceae bacterium]MCF8064784.1 TRAP transporter substrate-binding protein [Desulfarculaceae bacterium]MCF8123223.1 TRAP transporter substrate-binding protein [Desulfarculaceae bacterium]
MKRRDFLKKAGAGAAAAAAATAISAPAVLAKKKIKWKMVTTWPPKLPYLQTGAVRLAKRVKEMSGGQFDIKVYAAGELIPAFGSFEAVSNGTVQAGSGAAYYWAGKTPAAQWFAAVPFGLNAVGMAAWFWGGDGLKLWEETYAPFNLVPRPAGNTGVQMGGWFNKKIETINDFKGLKMRIPGLGGKVLAKAGGTVVLTPGGEIFTNLERGVIDATEWVGPLHDYIMGFYKVAKYYYYPGWHEPGTVLENFFNKKAYDALPKEYQTMLDMACAETYNWMLSGFNADNGAALEKLITKHNVNLVRFPADVLAQLRTMAYETLDEIAAKDKQAGKVHAAFKKFQKQVGVWGEVSEKAYYDVIAEKFSLKG